MKKTYVDLNNEKFDVDLQSHDISKYDVLFHVSLKDRKKSIEDNGILRHQTQHKSLVKTDLIFLSYPVDMDTSDCFRWNDEFYCLIILDAKKLQEDRFVFYDDYFGRNDNSSKRNHICCDVDIPIKYIQEIVEF